MLANIGRRDAPQQVDRDHAAPSFRLDDEDSENSEGCSSLDLRPRVRADVGDFAGALAHRALAAF